MFLLLLLKLVLSLLLILLLLLLSQLLFVVMVVIAGVCGNDIYVSCGVVEVEIVYSNVINLMNTAIPGHQRIPLKTHD